MLDRVRRKLSRSSKSESFVRTQDPDHGHRPSLQRQGTLAGLDEERNVSRISVTDQQIITKLQFAPDQPMIERAPRKHTPSLATRSSERTIFNNVENGVLALPTEVLLTLQRYLTLCSEVALRQACSRFFHLYSTTSFYLSGDDKFDFLCMVERDQDKSVFARLVCGHCRELHPRRFFSSFEQRQPPAQRDCRQVWLCPHRSMGYEQTIRRVKAGMDSPFRAENIEPCNKCRETIRSRAVADRPERSGSKIDVENPKAESLLISKVALLQAPSPSHNTRSGAAGIYTETFHAKDVSDALQALNFALCPHIRLGDPYILSKFCRACINTVVIAPGVKGPPCISEVKDRDIFGRKQGGKCKGSCYIRGCKTRFMFQARESLAADASGKRQVWLIIVAYRWLGPLLTAGKESTWREHAVNAPERIEMKNTWEKWTKTYRGRQCMPNWSICLLHPEDCNLR